MGKATTHANDRRLVVKYSYCLAACLIQTCLFLKVKKSVR